MKTKSFKSKIESLHQIQSFARENLSLYQNDEKQLLRIDFIIEEIVVNIINYGCKEIENGVIDIAIDTSDNTIILEISDNGVAFNPLEEKEPDITKGLDNLSPGGLGIFLVKQIAKKIKYTRQDNKNRLRLFLK